MHHRGRGQAEELGGVVKFSGGGTTCQSLLRHLTVPSSFWEGANVSAVKNVKPRPRCADGKRVDVWGSGWGHLWEEIFLLKYQRQAKDSVNRFQKHRRTLRMWERSQLRAG